MRTIDSSLNESKYTFKIKKQIIRLRNSHEEDISVLTFDSTGKWLASGDWDGLLKLWNLEKEELQWTKGLFSEAVGFISFIDEPSKRVVAISLGDFDVHCFDQLSGKQLWVDKVAGFRREFITTYINKIGQTFWVSPASHLEKNYHLTVLNLSTREKQMIEIPFSSEKRLKISGHIIIVSVDPLIAIFTVVNKLTDQKGEMVLDNELILYDLDKKRLLTSKRVLQEEVFGLLDSKEKEEIVISYMTEKEYILELWGYNIIERTLQRKNGFTTSLAWFEEIKRMNWLVSGKRIIVINTDDTGWMVDVEGVEKYFSNKKEVFSWKNLLKFKKSKIKVANDNYSLSAIATSVDEKLAIANDDGVIAIGTMEGLTNILSKGKIKDKVTEINAFTWNKEGTKFAYIKGLIPREVVVVSVGKKIKISRFSCRKMFSRSEKEIDILYWDCANNLVIVTSEDIMLGSFQQNEITQIWSFQPPDGYYIETSTINPARSVLVCSLKHWYSEDILLFFDLKKEGLTYGKRNLVNPLPEGAKNFYWGSTPGHIIIQTTGQLTDFPLTSKRKLKKWKDKGIDEWTKVSWGVTREKFSLLAYTSYSHCSITLINPKKGIIGKLTTERPPIAITFIVSTNILLVAEDDGHISLWKCSSKPYKIWRKDVKQAGCLWLEGSPVGKQVVTVGADRSMKFWELT